MAQVIEQHPLAALDISGEARGIVRRNQPVTRAPDDQRGQLQLADTLVQLAAGSLSEPLAQGLAISLAQGQLVIALDQIILDFVRIAIHVAYAGLDHASRQQTTHQRRQCRNTRQTKTYRYRLGIARIAGRIHQYQARAAFGMGQGKTPGQLTTKAVADQHDALHLQMIEQREEKLRVVPDTVIAIGERAGEAEAGQIQADHPALRRQFLRPAFPGVQAGGGAMQQQDRFGIIASSLITQVHGHATDIDELRRRWRPARLELVQRTIRRPVEGDESGQSQPEHQHQAEQHVSESFHRSSPERSGKRDANQTPRPRLSPGRRNRHQNPASSIHSGREIDASSVDREITALTLRLSSAVRAKAITLTPLGQAASSTSTLRAVSLRPGSRPLSHQTSAGNSSSLATATPQA